MSALATATAVTCVGWLAFYVAVVLRSRPARVPDAPPTQEFGGPEPPAVVSVLLNGFRVTPDAVESTLLDLAARDFLALRHTGDDPRRTTVAAGRSLPAVARGRGGNEGLAAFERTVLERVRTVLAEPGRPPDLPLGALTFRDAEAAAAWTKTFEDELRAHVRALGLSRSRVSPAARRALGLAAIVPAALGALLGVGAMSEGGTTDAVNVSLAALAIGGAIWGASWTLASRPLGERDTPAGLAAAARWSGLRSYLRVDESFQQLPPAAVTVWGRNLAYGTALGLNRVCSAVLDLGLGDPTRVWSSFGGHWRLVEVRYPTGDRHRYGTAQLAGFGLLLLGGAASILLGGGVSAFIALDLGGWYWLAPGALLPLGLLHAWGAWSFLGAIVRDTGRPVSMTGEVLWLVPWTEKGAESLVPAEPALHQLAVDDGRSRRLKAWVIPADLAAGLEPGHVVTLTARPWSRRVQAISRSPLPTAAEA